ncbi:hypothetical protein H0N99_01880 [Candidatus Micrarchaeota archaeon]|nr:hypothetical protein [Candidatus Micrarchaeota archaeon]
MELRKGEKVIKNEVVSYDTRMVDSIPILMRWGGTLYLTNQRLILRYHPWVFTKEFEIPLTEIKDVCVIWGRFVGSTLKVGYQHLGKSENIRFYFDPFYYELFRSELVTANFFPSRGTVRIAEDWKDSIRRMAKLPATQSVKV